MRERANFATLFRLFLQKSLERENKKMLAKQQMSQPKSKVATLKRRLKVVNQPTVPIRIIRKIE